MENEVEIGHKVAKVYEENFYHTSNMVKNYWKNKFLHLRRWLKCLVSNRIIKTT